eukprot:4209592-Amphidinium_carterae.1
MPEPQSYGLLSSMYLANYQLAFQLEIPHEIEDSKRVNEAQSNNSTLYFHSEALSCQYFQYSSHVP